MYKKLTLLMLAISSLWFTIGVSHAVADDATLLESAQKSAMTLPEYVFEVPSLSDESDKDVHALIKQASLVIQNKPRQARKNYIKALTLVKSGKAISEYDYLWTRYGLLKSSFEAGTGDFGPGNQADYIKLAEQTLRFLRQNEIWEFTELGAFKKENYRVAGNGLAWQQMKLAKNNQELEAALDNVEYAVGYIEGPAHYYILDTKVRILLKLKRQQAAFAGICNR